MAEANVPAELSNPAGKPEGDAPITCDNLPVIKFEQLGERADLLKGEQRIEQYGGLFHQSLLSPQPRRGRTGWSVVHVLKSIQPRLGLGPAVAVLDKEHGDKAQGDEKGRVGE